LIETDSDSNRPISKEKNHPNKRFPIPKKPVSETFGQLLPLSNPFESPYPTLCNSRDKSSRQTTTSKEKPTGLPDILPVPLKDQSEVLLKTNPIP
jgi:hypothetical protein